MLMAIGDNYKIAVSVDNGATWTLKDSGETGCNFKCVCYANGKFYIGATTSKILATPDGDNFEAVLAPKSFYYIVHNGSYFLAKSKEEQTLYTSKNGIDWFICASTARLAPGIDSFLAYHPIGKIVSICADAGSVNESLYMIALSQSALPTIPGKYIKIKE